MVHLSSTEADTSSKVKSIPSRTTTVNMWIRTRCMVWTSIVWLSGFIIVIGPLPTGFLSRDVWSYGRWCQSLCGWCAVTENQYERTSISLTVIIFKFSTTSSVVSHRFEIQYVEVALIEMLKYFTQLPRRYRRERCRTTDCRQVRQDEQYIYL